MTQKDGPEHILASDAGAHFAPFVRLTASTLALVIAAMFMVATTRTAAAFAEVRSYPGRFVNRTYFADYSSAGDQAPHLFSLTMDPEVEDGVPAVRSVEVAGFTELRPQIIDAVEADIPAASSTRDRSLVQREVHQPHDPSSTENLAEIEFTDANGARRGAGRTADAAQTSQESDISVGSPVPPDLADAPGPLIDVLAEIGDERLEESAPDAAGRPAARPARATPTPAANTMPIAPTARSRRDPTPLPDDEFVAPTAEPHGTVVPAESPGTTNDAHPVATPQATLVPTSAPTQSGTNVGSLHSTTGPTLSTTGDSGLRSGVANVVQNLPIVPTVVTVATVGPTSAPATPRPTARPQSSDGSSGHGSAGTKNSPTAAPAPTVIPTVRLPIVPTVGSVLSRV